MDHFKIKEQSLKTLEGNRLMLFVLLLIVAAIASIGSAAIGIGYLVSLILSGGVYLTVRQMLLEKKQINLELALISIFKDINHSVKIMVVGLLYNVLVVVGTVLLIVPGIYWGLQYSQAQYIIVNNKDMDIFDAFKESKKMMDGNKSDLFLFILGFIGHFLLGIVTFGIYLLYFMPYFVTCQVNYHLHLTNAYAKHEDPEVVEAQI